MNCVDQLHRVINLLEGTKHQFTLCDLEFVYMVPTFTPNKIFE
jgi:hypothetical protein